MIKEAVRNLKGYDLKPMGSEIRLNLNESPLDIPLALKNDILSRMGAISWNRYPEMQPAGLLRQLSVYTGHPEEGILASNGSDDLIQLLLLASCGRNNRMLTVAPTFGVYKLAAAAQGVETLEIPLNADFSFDTRSILAALQQDNGIKIVFLTSPNNPTGNILPLEELEAIASATGGLVALDEAYYEFYGLSAVNLIIRHPNLVILRTLSKALRSAGLRIGYLLGDGDIVGQLRKIRLPFSLGALAQCAGESIVAALLQQPQLFSIDTIISERERVFSILQALPGIIPFPSRGNFILFRSAPGEAAAICAQLLRDGVAVRDFSDPVLQDHIRVTIGLPTENDLFLTSLQNVLRK